MGEKVGARKPSPVVYMPAVSEPVNVGGLPVLMVQFINV
jgi:hypothetical protein